MTDKQVVLITGSATGLGAVLIRSFAEHGYNVVINYLKEGEGDSLRDEIANEFGEDSVLACQANVADREAVKSMFDATIDKFGQVDVLINCAGINIDSPFTEITDQTWDAVIDAHLKGHFVCGQEFVFHNQDREGAIVNIGAAAGSIGRKNGANFCAAKAGVIVLTKCMALELAPKIRVNCLVPGSVRTREVIERYDLESDDGLKKELATLPMGRLGDFEDIAHMVHCMVNAKFTTGAKFFVNGGQYMH